MNHVELDRETITLLRQARRGARSLGWMVLFLLMTGVMMSMMLGGVEGWASIAGALLVSLLTSWILMLFFSKLGQFVTDSLLKLLSPSHRLLFKLEKEGDLPAETP